MASGPSPKRGAGGGAHPARGALLAFLRGQCSGEQEKRRISEHLLAGCAPCARACAELARSSAALDQLGSLSQGLRYPELEPHRVLAHAQRGLPLTSAFTGERKRRKSRVARNAAGRLRGPLPSGSLSRASLPAAFVFGLLCAVALAYALVTPHLPPPDKRGAAGNQIHRLMQMGTALAPHALPPTPTAGASKAATPLPTGTLRPRPSLAFCPSTANARQRLPALCGRGFRPGDSVVLKVTASGHPWLQIPVQVDARGDFRVSLPWLLSGCWPLPVSIVAEDTSVTPDVSSNELTNASIPACQAPSPVPTGAAH